MNEQSKIAIIILNWNGEEDSLACLAALRKQTTACDIIAVDNDSADNFSQIIKEEHPNVVLLQNNTNLGFAGGVNTGIRYAASQGYKYVALINNDAIPDKEWAIELYKAMQKDVQIGICTGKLLRTNGLIDSTGDTYTSWGLAYPRGRDTEDNRQYENSEYVFSGTGGASMYNLEMLAEIGLFDEDFFAYYEDVDLSFRAQLAGWKISYQPTAIAYHKVGASSGKVHGLTTYMTIKNLPWLFWKNVPLRLIPTILPRFFVAYWSIFFSALSQGNIWPAVKGVTVSILLLPKKLVQRRRIQKNRTVGVNYIKNIITHDLPPNAAKLRRLRQFFSFR